MLILAKTGPGRFFVSLTNILAGLLLSRRLIIRRLNNKNIMNQLVSIFQLYGLALAMVLNFGMGIFVFFRNPREPIHRIFLLLAAALGIWCICTYLDVYYYNQAAIFDFFDRLAYVSGLFIAFFFYLFTFLYPYKSSSIFKSAILIYSGVILVFTYIIYTPLFVIDVKQTDHAILPSHNPTTYLIYSLILIAPFMLGLAELYRKMQNGDGVYRKGFPFLIAVMTIVILVSLYFDLFLSGINNNDFISIGPISSLLFIYAIMRMIISKE